MQDDKEMVKNAVRKIMKLGCYIAFPILFGLAAISEPLVVILITDKWLPSVPFLRIFCISSALSILNTLNLQVIKGIGQSKTLLKLEMLKKPIYLSMIIITMFISPLAIAIGNLIYSFIALMFNAFPTKKYLDYTIKEQFKDFYPSLLLAASMAIFTLGIGFIPMNIYLQLLFQIVFGISYYVIGSKLLKIDSFNYLLNFIKSKVKQK